MPALSFSSKASNSVLSCSTLVLASSIVAEGVAASATGGFIVNDNPSASLVAVARSALFLSNAACASILSCDPSARSVSASSSIPISSVRVSILLSISILLDAAMLTAGIS